MWETPFKLLTASLLAFTLCGDAQAQLSGNSPFSRFGLGDLTESGFVHLQSLGGLSAAYGDQYQTNLGNPASLARLQATSFEIGFDVSRSYLSDNDSKAQFWGGGLNYLSLSFPIFSPLNRALDRKSTDFGWGMNMSLKPYSRTNASSSLTEDVLDVGSVTREFEGSGALNQVTWANGFHWKNLYGGLQLSYLFGQIRQERSVLYNSIAFPYHIYSRDDFSFRGFLWNLGAQYDLDLSEGKGKDDPRLANTITFGISAGTKSALTTITDRLRATRQVAWGGLSDDLIDSGQEGTDTIRYSTEAKENGSLPATFQIGAVWRKGQRWLVGFNFSQSGWSSFESSVLQGTLKNTYRVGIGAEFVPDEASYRYYHHRMRYRLGLNFGTDPRVIEGQQIKETILNVGVGLPIYLSRQISFINLGVEYANRGGDLPITENRLTFKMGVTLNNNLWFYKRKYN
ncbi:MAG: outer membrane protein transport protein [Saprospiraceae bacterium]|nr:outer membrane protein transport protein [Saprospiraceae bacterium]